MLKSLNLERPTIGLDKTDCQDSQVEYLNNYTEYVNTPVAVQATRYREI